MKQANLAFMIALVVVVVLFKIFTRDSASAPQQLAAGQVPQQPVASPTLDAGVQPEAAFYQQPSDFAPATGASENISGEEPLGAL